MNTTQKDLREGMRDPRNSDPFSIDHSGGSSFITLHYALATKVDALVDRQQELSQNLSSLASEVRQPRPVPWGSLITLVVGLLAVIATIGGLVHQSISDRIAVNTAEITRAEARSTRRDDSFITKDQFNDSIQLLRETSKRLEDVQSTANKLGLELNVTKAEFNATVNGFGQRQIRNEQLIEEARKAEVLNNRINQLYELYRILQGQAHDELLKQIQLHDQIQARSNGNVK